MRTRLAATHADLTSIRTNCGARNVGNWRVTATRGCVRRGGNLRTNGLDLEKPLATRVGRVQNCEMNCWHPRL